ncbi:MAG: Esterase [Candidatus Roizmanbacteria bacterium GW2011_GWA2_35_19]|uniref:Esterase n=2 Tax=Candidatus Roizmaniibacteriota TaxID=1752723 RepID=A0A0G0BUG6_9BACT|nr:MAG: Esterase [Candidatus Roizmanbacteria bacterium GW2011_GWC2_35_12]KKP72968.1 MAG: Esterase [Candidatus Roizmanbacteria bacterium GW2011_GWA2_35_19]
MKLLLNTLLSLLVFLSLIAIPVNALTFDLIAPSGQLQSGQDVKFTINIDTEGKSLTSTSIGMTYQTSDLEYVSTVPGNTFTTITTDAQAGGKLIISGSSTGGYSGSGSYAVVTFKLIATAPGSSQLCALFNPVVPSSPPAPTLPPAPSSPPAPTSLPQTGSFAETVKNASLGLVFFGLAAVGFLVFKKI